MAELPQSEFIYFIVIGTIGMLSITSVMAVFIVFYQKRMLNENEKRKQIELRYQQMMIQSQIESQETERKRIAADLHDSIGSLLWAAKLNVSFLGRSIKLTDEIQDSYDETLKILEQSIDSVRRISWELTPEAFNQHGFSSSVKELCQRLNGKGVNLLWRESGQSVFWKDSNALMLFRIVQELVNNAVKHSQANTIDVSLQWEKENIVIIVSDDGIGFTLNENNKNGVGWWNIMHRADKITATVEKLDHVSKGSSIKLKAPISK